MEDDPAIGLHIPGMRLRLIGSEKVAAGPRLAVDSLQLHLAGAEEAVQGG